VHLANGDARRHSRDGESHEDTTGTPRVAYNEVRTPPLSEGYDATGCVAGSSVTDLGRLYAVVKSY
jgi:hypothetical protein